MNETPAPKKRGFLRRLGPSSVAGKAALLTAIVLLLTLLTVWLIRLLGSQRVSQAHTMSWTRMLLEAALVVVIPIVLYWGLRRWNQVIEGVYPDIDQAWQAGMDALAAQGIAVSDHPIFLILGSAQQGMEQGLIQALEAKFHVQGIPNTAGVSHALQWYASSEAIYLFCPGTSSLSALAGRWSAPAQSNGERRPLPIRTAAPSVQAARPAESPAAATPATATPATATPAAATPATATPATATPGTATPGTAGAAPRPAEPHLGTLYIGAMGSPPAEKHASPAVRPAAGPATARATPFSSPAAPATSAPGEGKPQYYGTLSTEQLTAATASAGRPTPQQNASNTPPPSRPTAAGRTAATARPVGDHPPAARDQAQPHSATAPRVAVGKLALPAALDTSHQIPRLRYVCKLLRRVRRPRCGLNGIVTLFPFEMSRVGPLQLSALAQSARGDVNVIQETLGIRCPLTATLVGLEQDKGFNELVRRLQPELLSRRLGGRFDLRSRPTPEELNSHSDRLCDAFEDWVYRLYGRDDALAQQRGNRKLYELISRIRHELKPRLRIVLGEAFGCEPNTQPGTPQRDRSFFFSGCYFVASGATTGQPAFVKGVLKDKLEEEQSQVEWTDAALRRHTYFRLFAIVGWIVTGILAILLLVNLLGSA